MLDANVLSDRVRNRQGRVAVRIAEVGEAAIGTSIIVTAELRFGAAKKGSARLTLQLERILSAFEIQAFDAPADAAYADLRAQLETAGLSIGSNEMLIAAHALATDCIFVTDNVREFTRVSGLKVENWLR